MAERVHMFKLAVGGACRVFAYTVNWGKIDP